MLIKAVSNLHNLTKLPVLHIVIAYMLHLHISLVPVDQCDNFIEYCYLQIRIDLKKGAFKAVFPANFYSVFHDSQHLPHISLAATKYDAGPHSAPPPMGAYNEMRSGLIVFPP
jgi:hypothetical protein